MIPGFFLLQGPMEDLIHIPPGAPDGMYSSANGSKATHIETTSTQVRISHIDEQEAIITLISIELPVET